MSWLNLIKSGVKNKHKIRRIDKLVSMSNSKIRCIYYGLWIGLLLTGSAIVELFLQDQVYSYRTFMVVAILSVTGIFSSIVSWGLFWRLGRSSYATAIILSLANIILFVLIGAAVSYVVIDIIPEFFKTAQDPDHGGFGNIFQGMVSGFLSAAFAFKTFGLLLLWPLGVISGISGTYVFVYINSKINSSTRH